MEGFGEYVVGTRNKSLKRYVRVKREQIGLYLSQKQSTSLTSVEGGFVEYLYVLLHQ